MRLKMIGDEIIKNVGKYESCMVSKLPIIFKRTHSRFSDAGAATQKNQGKGNDDDEAVLATAVQICAN